MVADPGLPWAQVAKSGDATPDLRRVVVVDDHELLRAGTRRLLEDAGGFTVVGEADDGERALEVIAASLPDIALVDIRLPTMNGIELAGRIVAAHPTVTVLILSAYDDEDYVQAAFEAGVSGYLLKTTRSPELVAGILSACDRGPVRPVGKRRPVVEGANRTPGPVAPLTSREQEVVRLVAQGMTNRVIGSRLGISPRTVEGHLNHAFEKLGTSSRTELVHYAFTHGLLPPAPPGPASRTQPQGSGP
ncbi:MAG: response regulator transcription factor [Actinomycetota bacterium]|jgi:DNA-binding NarL/FixJ family response regulator|nr:response regulator transcription factor [Actinomycetota bacterium]